MKVFRPFFFIAAFMLIMGLAACSGASPTPAPIQPTVAATMIPATETPAPSVTPPPSPTPTDVPASTAIPSTIPTTWFTENFDQEPLNWNYIVLKGKEKNKDTLSFGDSLAIFKIDDVDIDTYYIFEGNNNKYKYKDVRVELRSENRGVNNNKISLICRYSAEGWYEFSAMGNGLWYLYAVIPVHNVDGKFDYNLIGNGAAIAINQGKAVNELSMTCSGNEIKLNVNGEDIRTIKDTKFALRNGNVGLGVSSSNSVPIVVEVDWLKTSQP